MGFFSNGARAGGNKTSTREGSFPLGLLVNADEVANLIDSSLMEKGIESPFLSRGSTGSSLAQDLGGLTSVGLPTPQTDRHLVVRTRCFRVGVSTHQTERHRMVR